MEKYSTQIEAIAHDVRAWAEQYAQDHDFPDDLRGLCAIAAGELFTRLKGLGYKIKLCAHIGEAAVPEANTLCHCFVVCDGYVIDVTAKQFKKYKDKKVLILPVEKAKENSFHKQTVSFTKVDDLRMYQLRNGWVDTEIV